MATDTNRLRGKALDRLQYWRLLYHIPPSHPVKVMHRDLWQGQAPFLILERRRR